MSMVNSYMPRNCFSPDRTVYDTFITMNAEEEAVLEFTRGRAWRNSQQLKALVETQTYTNDAKELVDYLSKVRNEIQMTIDLLSRRVSDKVEFVDEVAISNQKSAMM